MKGIPSFKKGFLRSNLEMTVDELEKETAQEIEQHFKYEKLKRYLEKTLIKYLTRYIKKEFRMNEVFIAIRKKLKDEEEISERNFHQIIKFLERERPFRGQDRKKIFDFFSPVIHQNIDRPDVGTFERFLHS